MKEITSQATENLRVIRELMERTTVYRTISSPVAIFGGLLGLLLAAVLATGGKDLAPVAYLGIWLAAYLIIDGFNALMLWRNHQKTGDPFLSPKMLHAIKLLLPPMLAGGVIGTLAGLAPDSLPLSAMYWSVFYGLALLATFSFSPKSITVLGALFLGSGLVMLVLWFLLPGLWTAPPVVTASWIMGTTFGLFHLVYGVAVKSSREPEKAKGEPTPEAQTSGVPSPPPNNSTGGLS